MARLRDRSRRQSPKNSAMRFDKTRRNVALLAVCQAFGMANGSIAMVTAGLVGHWLLGDDKTLATLPLGLQFLGTTLFMVPASLISVRIGRRRGFMIGSAMGFVGGAICTWAIYEASFLLFCLGCFVMGGLFSTIMLYRFAAVDTADEKFRAKAISLVLLGGIAAAVLGPTLSRGTVDLLAPVTFAGCYAAVMVLTAIVTLVLAFLDIPPASAEERRDTGRPLLTILRQPRAAVAMAGGAIAYAVMVLVMSATPLAMMACNHGFNITTHVIQWHGLGMYLPSLFSGHLINRFGSLNIMTAGAVLFLGASGAALSGIDVEYFFVALILLGVGWNFMFVGSTTLLTYAYEPRERGKVQGFNDFLIYGSVTVSVGVSGALQNGFGWEAVNYGMLPVIALALGLVLWLRVHIAREPLVAE
ncbi:MAG: MFS transporter [Rhodospirillaceae bacterium]|nr:MFS transporter [Rhodospirillaceae bacterium]MBT6118314.1 MFS transporter [Rhodospirillaceae bacterium]